MLEGVRGYVGVYWHDNTGGYFMARSFAETSNKGWGSKSNLHGQYKELDRGGVTYQHPQATVVATTTATTTTTASIKSRSSTRTSTRTRTGTGSSTGSSARVGTSSSALGATPTSYPWSWCEPWSV